jgi:hypothetical protein
MGLTGFCSGSTQQLLWRLALIALRTHWLSALAGKTNWRLALIALWTHWLFAQVLGGLWFLALIASWDSLAASLWLLMMALVLARWLGL